MKSMSLTLSLVSLSSLVLSMSANAGIIVRREIRGGGVNKTIVAELSGVSYYNRHDTKNPDLGDNPKKAEVTISETTYTLMTDANGNPMRNYSGNMVQIKTEKTVTKSSLYMGEFEGSLQTEAAQVAKNRLGVKYLDSSYAVEFPSQQIFDYLEVGGQQIPIQALNVMGIGGAPLDGKHVSANALIKVLDTFDDLSVE